jgi:hypothetical protein
MKLRNIAASVTLLVLLSGVIGIQQAVSKQITSKVQREMPNASGISASIPLKDLPSSLTSDSIKSAQINIESFFLKESGTKTSLKISASEISKAKPTMIGSLEVTATISAETIAKSSEFNDAQIVGNALQVSAGSGGLGKALLIPKYSDNQLYFELQSVSLFGSEIPASSLPAELNSQIKSKSQRTLTPPNGLTVKSVSLSSKGLSVQMTGSKVQLGTLGSGL